MLCSSSFKSGTKCFYKAKFVFESADEKHFVCRRHLIQSARDVFDFSIGSMGDIPGLTEISEMNAPTTISVINAFDDAVLVIKACTDLNLIKDGDCDYNCDIERHPVKVEEKEYVLSICKDGEMMEDMYEAMCIQVDASKRSCDSFIPIATSEVLGRSYPVAKMIRTSESMDSSSRRIPYFYQLEARSFQLRNFAWDPKSLKEFVIQMCSLIQQLHTARMCFGDFNYHSLALLDPNDPKSVRLVSAANITFWINTSGEFKSSRSGPGTTFPLTSSRQVHVKLSPGRYDDFESLLYLVLTIQKKILPWHDSTSVRDVNRLKDAFLQDPGLYIQIDDIDSLNSLCKMIVDAEYDERPIYERINQLFTAIAE